MLQVADAILAIALLTSQAEVFTVLKRLHRNW